MTGISVRSTNSIYSKLRHRSTEECEKYFPFSDSRDVDESYFGPKRMKGKRGRGAGSKTIVFCLFKREGFVYTEIVPDTRKRTLPSVIRGKISVESIIRSDGWRGYHDCKVIIEV